MAYEITTWGVLFLPACFLTWSINCRFPYMIEVKPPSFVSWFATLSILQLYLPLTQGTQFRVLCLYCFYCLTIKSGMTGLIPEKLWSITTLWLALLWQLLWFIPTMPFLWQQRTKKYCMAFWLIEQ